MEPHVSSEIPAADSRGTRGARHTHGACPWYIGYLLVNPLRRLFEDPDRLLQPFVRPGMTVLEPGCGMGFFSLPLARMVGAEGRVVCVDMQQKMIDGLRRRAQRARVLDRIDTVVAGADDLRVAPWNGRVDLVFAIHMVHEVPDAPRFYRQIRDALRAGGRLVIIEPSGHVSAERFQASIENARAAGFAADAGAPVLPKKLSVVLQAWGGAVPGRAGGDGRPPVTPVG